jgi:hypothetical protein
LEAEKQRLKNEEKTRKLEEEKALKLKEEADKVRIFICYEINSTCQL